MQTHQTFEGVYENGVVRFPTPIALPDHTKVTVTPQADAAIPVGCSSDEIYEILSRRYNTGEKDLAARVDEHQP